MQTPTVRAQTADTEANAFGAAVWYPSPVSPRRSGAQVLTIVNTCSLDGFWIGTRSYPAGANATGDLACINSNALDINVPFSVNVSGCGARPARAPAAHVLSMRAGGATRAKAASCRECITAGQALGHVCRLACVERPALVRGSQGIGRLRCHRLATSRSAAQSAQGSLLRTVHAQRSAPARCALPAHHGRCRAVRVRLVRAARRHLRTHSRGAPGHHEHCPGGRRAAAAERGRGRLGRVQRDLGGGRGHAAAVRRGVARAHVCVRGPPPWSARVGLCYSVHCCSNTASQVQVLLLINSDGM